MADYVYPELLNKYEFRNYGHALEILSEVFPKEWKEIQECLAKFVITEDDLLVAGEMKVRYLKSLMIYYIHMGGRK